MNDILQQCAICNKRFADLRSHLRKHKITWQEYRDKYNTVPINLVRVGKYQTDEQKMIMEYEISNNLARQEHFRKKGF